MDIALALWQINPEYEYLLNDDKTEIIEWRNEDSQPTPAELEAAWLLCPLAYSIEADKETIKGDGVDVATVTVRMPTESWDVTVNGDTHTIDAERTDFYGYGEILLDSTEPGTVIEVRGTGVNTDSLTVEVQDA